LNNYKPVSILPAISKVIEQIVKKMMLDFLLKYELFSSKQFGFLPKRNTSQAIYEHISEITEKLEHW